MQYRSPLWIALAVSLAGCIGIPGPAGGDPDAAPPDPETFSCERALGELLPSPAFDVTADARDAVLADLDRDGLDDVIALLAPDRIAVAHTRPYGGYDAPVELAREADLGALAAIDFDGDGDLDIVAAGAVVIVLRNDAGTLVEEYRQAAPCAIDVLVPGQFDDDVRADLVAGCSADGRVVLMRHGDATPLTAPVDIGTFEGLRGAVAGEVAGDARDDLVVYGLLGVDLLQAIGGGSFSRTHVSGEVSPAAATGDVDADGRDDVLAWVGAGLAWLRGGATPGSLVPLEVGDVRRPQWIELGAIDDSPGDDLVLVEDESQASLYRTLVIASPLTEASLEVQPVGSQRRCRLGRLDDDDVQDLACVSPYGSVRVPVIHRDAIPAVTRAVGTGALLAQLDDDPALEVLTTGATVEVLEPAGDRFVVEASGADPTFHGQPVAAVDWNHDGLPDLISNASRDPDGGIELRLGTGAATLGAPIELVDELWVQLVVGDLDDDSYPDLAGWTLSTSGDVKLHVVFGGPGGTIADSLLQADLRSVAIIDVVAGGAPELVVADENGELQIVDASDRALSVVHRIGGSAYPLTAVAADLDGDGDLDLVTLDVNNSMTSARTYLRTDDRFEAESSQPMRGWVEELVVADVDGDEAPDVIAGELMLLQGQGDGRLAPPVPFTRPSRLVGSVRAPAGAADQLIYLVSTRYDAGTIEMLRPGCR